MTPGLGGPGSRFRLVEYGGGGGPRTLPRLYGSALEAVLAAENLLAALEHKPHRRPFRVDVQDIWTRETVSRVVPDMDRDPDVCVACHQPVDPFAGGVEQVAAPPTPPGDANPASLAGDAAGPGTSDNTPHQVGVDPMSPPGEPGP